MIQDAGRTSKVTKYVALMGLKVALERATECGLTDDIAANATSPNTVNGFCDAVAAIDYGLTPHTPEDFRYSSYKVTIEAILADKYQVKHRVDSYDETRVEHSIVIAVGDDYWHTIYWGPDSLSDAEVGKTSTKWVGVKANGEIHESEDLVDLLDKMGLELK